MIKNKRQYNITNSQILKFEAAIHQMKSENSDLHPLLAQAQLDAAICQKKELEEQVLEYDRLVSGKYNVLEVDSFNELPKALIRARIALGLTQKELAERLGYKEQQIQRYEDSNYESASFSRLTAVIEALDLKVREDIFLPSGSRSTTMLIDRLNDVGLSKKLLTKRLQPTYSLTKEEWANKLVKILEPIFGWTREQLIGDKALVLGRDSGLTARFKMPASAREDYASAYTVYAHYIATLALKAYSASRSTRVEIDALQLRKNLLEKYGDVSFKSVLSYVWSIGIPVIPLTDSGAFHGATWRLNGQNIIVLKQRSGHASKWCFDLLHELYHAGQNPDKENLSVVESKPTSEERRKDQEEIEANRFAEKVILGKDADAMITRCIKDARGRISWLKSSVKAVAEREEIDVGVLAYQVAYRIDEQARNKGTSDSWWGAANNLQTNSYNPKDLCFDELLKNIDLSILTTEERQLIELAIDYH